MAKFLTFTFDGINSSKYNVYVVNEGDSIILPSSPSFTDQVAAPSYQNTIYYLGTNISSKTFTIKCVAKDITMNQYQEMMRWLNIEKVGKLVLDNAPYFYSTVKISSFSETSLLGSWDEKKDTYHATFSLQFTTIGDYAQQNLKEYNYNLDIPYQTYDYLDPMYKLPMIWYDNSVRVRNTKEVYVVNYNSLPMFLDINIGATSSFAIWKHTNNNPTYMGTWNASTNKATLEDGSVISLDTYPEQNNIYFIVSTGGTFNYRDYEKNDILIARDGYWFKETQATLCDDLYYNYDMINFEPPNSEWIWDVYDINVKSQYGFITDEKTNRLIEVTINQQLEKLEDEAAFKGIPEYFNNGIMSVEPSSVTFVPTIPKTEYTQRVHVSKRKYWLKLTADENLLINLSKIKNDVVVPEKNKSFIYFTYSEPDQNGDFVQKNQYLEIFDNVDKFVVTDNVLYYYVTKEEYEVLTNLIKKENFMAQIVNVEAAVIKINSLLTAEYIKEVTLKEFPKFIGGHNNTTTVYMLGFDKYTSTLTQDQIQQSDIEYLYHNAELDKWCVNRTYGRKHVANCNIIYSKYLVDEGWEDSYDTPSGTIAATNVDTKGRSFLETQEEFNQGINQMWNNYVSRKTIKCQLDLGGISLRKLSDRKAKIWSNCFNEITPGEDVEGMYHYNGKIYLHIDKSRLTDITDWTYATDSAVRTAIKTFLNNMKCFFFYEVERYDEVLAEYDQMTLWSSRTDQICYGQSVYSGTPTLKDRNTQRKFTSNSTNVFLLEQNGSTVQLDLKLRNQF